MIKVYRASGNPVNLEHVNLFREEHEQFYDKVVKKFNIKETDKLSPEMSERLSKLFKRKENFLMKKYPLEADWPEITTEKEWKEKVKQYGNIMVSRDVSKDTLIYVIFDIEV